MPVIFFEALKKLAPFLKYIVFGTAIILLLLVWRAKSNALSKLDQELQLYKRQMADQLTDKEKQLEGANQKLGLSQSKLMEQKDLAKAFEQDRVKVSADFEKFKKQYKIELESYQKTIASLQQQLHGGKTTVSGGEPRLPSDPRPDKQFDKPIDPRVSKLAYDWKSEDGRFELQDPDVFVRNNETFKLQQNFRVIGEIYREKTGFLKTQRLTIEEVLPDGKNPDGTVKYKTIASANIVDSKFNYTESAPDSWIPKKGAFGLWPTISAGLSLANGLNPHLVIGTGIDWVSYKGLGSGVNIYVDTTIIQQSAFGLDISYRPTILGHQLNLGLFAGIATEFVRPFNSYDILGGVKFFLW